MSYDSNPNFSMISEQLTNGFSRQEPSSVIERESTAPCVSPEPSHASLENEFNENHHAHFKPELSLPFIDADSVSSMVGHDDLRRAMSIRISRSVSMQGTARATPVIEIVENLEEALKICENLEELREDENKNEEEKQKNGLENGGMNHVIIANDEQQPSTSKESEQKEEMTPENHDPNEVKVPLIAVSRGFRV